jgi:hypothetical protein
MAEPMVVTSDWIALRADERDLSDGKLAPPKAVSAVDIRLTF